MGVSKAQASIASGLVPSISRRPVVLLGERGLSDVAAWTASKMRYNSGATSSSSTGGPMTCSGATTTRISRPAGSGGRGIWSTWASIDTLPGGPLREP